MSISLAGVGITSLVLVEEWFQQRNNDAAVGASFNQPEHHIEPSAFFDEEAEQVRQKFIEEQKEEEEEIIEMALHDKPAVANLEVEQKPAAVSFGGTVVVDDDEQPKNSTSKHTGGATFFL